MKNAMLILITFTKFILSMKSKKEYILFSESKYYRNHLTPRIYSDAQIEKKEYSQRISKNITF